MATDSFGRRIDYLRISITDRCNLRCVYCMPAEGVAWRGHDEILSFEEIERFAAVAVAEGISKIRLTGGEPLVRLGVVDHIRRLRAITGIESIALTTNGILLRRYAAELKEAGLERVNISLDTLDPDVYRQVTRGGDLAKVLDGIEAAFETGMHPVKLNVVVVRRLHQDLMAFARMTLERPLHVRFIEYMPVGGMSAENETSCGDSSTSIWTADDEVSSDEILAKLREGAHAEGLGELVAVNKDDAPGGWGPASYYRIEGAKGTLGVISPLSHHFCGECNRLRLTADGHLRPCLFSDTELDVRAALREGTSEDVHRVVREALAAKPESHHMRVGTHRGMSQIGG